MDICFVYRSTSRIFLNQKEYPWGGRRMMHKLAKLPNHSLGKNGALARVNRTDDFGGDLNAWFATTLGNFKRMYEPFLTEPARPSSTPHQICSAR